MIQKSFEAMVKIMIEETCHFFIFDYFGEGPLRPMGGLCLT